jgi:membrane-associated protease RseP (regulator of RpoE activity)
MKTSISSTLSTLNSGAHCRRQREENPNPETAWHAREHVGSSLRLEIGAQRRRYTADIGSGNRRTFRQLCELFRLAIVAACLLGAGPGLSGAESKTNAPAVPPPGAVTPADAPPADRVVKRDVRLKVVGSDPFVPNSKPVAWLGLATEEASEALVSQLQLEPGVGLAVTFVAPDGPAAKAGLKKNDVLVDFEGQPLVHPAQLRKLVQVRKDGDTVKLTYYRSGKKESASVTLARTVERFGGFEGEPGHFQQGIREFQDRMGEFQNQFRGEYGDAIREEARNLQRSLGHLRLDPEQIQSEVRRSVEQARRAAGDALRHGSNEVKRFGPSARMLENLARGWVGVDTNATVTINSRGSAVKTLVKADETGTYVIVSNPRKRLTAHDPAGKLLFDGEIETPEQQAAVPKEVWDKIKPLVTKMGTRVNPALESETESEMETEMESGQ